MRIRYLVPKEYICVPEKGDEIAPRPQTQPPPDVQLKHMDAARLRRQPALIDAQPKSLQMDVTYFPKTLRTKASWLLSELSSRGLKWNERGELYNNGKILPGTNILELINDVLRERKNSSPQGWRYFANLLHDYNIPKNLIQNPKRLIVAPTRDLPQYMGMGERGDDDDEGSNFTTPTNSPPPAEFEELF